MKIKNIILGIVLCFISITPLTSCKANSDICGKYVLYNKEIPWHFIEYLNYDYNYIILHDNYKYETKNKINNIVTHTDGKWVMSEDYTQFGFVMKLTFAASYVEYYPYDYENKTITIKTEIDSYDVTFTYKLEQ